MGSLEGGPLVKPEEMAGTLRHFRGREGLCREIASRITFYVYKGKHPDDCPSEGEEPEPLKPPSPGIKGGGRGEESDRSGPRGPKIISHQVLAGPRVVIKRLEKATVEESGRAMDVEMISDDSAPRCDSSSEEERGRTEPGPSKPRKRARGRPRKDGSGPFRPDTPPISQIVEMALDGEIPDLILADLVPIADRSRVRGKGTSGGTSSAPTIWMRMTPRTPEQKNGGFGLWMRSRLARQARSRR